MQWALSVTIHIYRPPEWDGNNDCTYDDGTASFETKSTLLLVLLLILLLMLESSGDKSVTASLAILDIVDHPTALNQW
jgi:hypothetical protein